MLIVVFFINFNAIAIHKKWFCGTIPSDSSRNHNFLDILD